MAANKENNKKTKAKKINKKILRRKGVADEAE